MNKATNTRSTAAPKTPKQQRSRETRTRILDATLECLAELGYAELSTMRVATRAGVSKGGLFQHFPTKTSLIVATMEYYHLRTREEFIGYISESTLTLSLKEKVSLFVYHCWNLIKTPEYISSNDVWAAARTNEDLKSALGTLVEREQSQVDILSAFPEYAEHPSITFLNHALMSALEGMSMDYHVIGEVEEHNENLEYLIELTVRELNRLKTAS